MNKDLLFSRTTLFTGEAELEMLQKSTVLIAGVGGLGCIVSELLVRRGIGELILVDQKEIDEPDLNRQLLYTSADLGRQKLEIAKQRLEAIHSFTKIETIDMKISDNMDFFDKVGTYKFAGIADCLDNYNSRFDLEKLLNDDNFLIHGGVRNDFGQVTTITKGKSLKALYAGQKEDGEPIPVCPEVVAIIGSLMVKEIINSILGKPQLEDKLLILELSDFSMFKLDVDLRGDSAKFGVRSASC